jgi:hypothetical protein
MFVILKHSSLVVSKKVLPFACAPIMKMDTIFVDYLENRQTFFRLEHKKTAKLAN